MDKRISVESFQNYIEEIVAISDKICDGWKFISVEQGTENNKFILKKQTIILTRPEDSETKLIANFEFHIAFSISYGVPILCFNIWKQNGSMITLEEYWQYNTKFNDNSMYETVTQMDHPVLNQPIFTLHPCKTQEILEPLMGKRGIPVMWICNPYILTYVCKPCRTWGWKIWQRYRIQYRFGLLSRRKHFTSNSNINYSVNCNCQLRVKSVDSSKKYHKIIKRKPKSKFKSKIKQSFQPKLDPIPELHSELGTESDLDLTSTKKTKNKFLSNKLIRKKIKNKFPVTKSTLPLNPKTPAALVKPNKNGKIFATQDPEFENPKRLSDSTKLNIFTSPNIKTCTEVTRADQETTTEFVTTIEMPKNDNSKITTPSNSYSFLYDPVNVESLNNPSYVNDSGTAYCKTMNYESANSYRTNGSLSLKQTQLISGSDDCKKYIRFSKTNASRPSTSHGVSNKIPPQLDLQISKIIPQPRPKPTPREKYNKDEHKTKTDDNRYKYGQYCRLYKHETTAKVDKRIKLLEEKVFDEMTPTKLEQNNKIKNDFRDISKHLYNVPTSSIKSESMRNNDNLTNSPPELNYETFRLPESHHNNMLYVLPIRNFPEAERNMQVVILHLDPIASRYLKPNEKESLVDSVQPEQDESWKKYISETKPCTKKLEEFTRSTFPKPKSRSENISKSRKTNIETASDVGVKNKHKYNRKQNDTCTGSKKRKMEDEPIQTEISIYSTEAQNSILYKYPEEFYKNIDVSKYTSNFRTGNVGLCHYPSFETFTIETDKDNIGNTSLDFSCQTRVCHKEEVTQTGESSYSTRIYENRLNKSNIEKYSKACNTIIAHESSNFSSQTYENDIYNKTKSLDNCKILNMEASLLKPQIYQYSGDNCPNELKNFIYAKYLNLDQSSATPTNNKIVFQPEETNTDISCSDQEDSMLTGRKNGKKIRNPARRKSLNTITKTEPRLDVNTYKLRKSVNVIGELDTPAKNFKLLLKENAYSNIQTILSGSVLEIKKQSFDKDTSTKWAAQDEALQTNISDKSIYQVLQNEDSDKSAQTLDYFTIINRESQVHPNQMYMVYYESNMYQNNKKQGCVQTDLNCLCNEPKFQESFVKCPYLSSYHDELNQTTISEEAVDYSKNENGDYLVAKYVIAEDQSSQTISRSCCDCFTQETSPFYGVEERFVQNKICQYNEPIHKTIEYNKNECRYFKTYKSGITKAASTSVSSTFFQPENTNVFKKSKIEKLASSVSSTCCNTHLFNQDITYKPCIKATSTSSSCICFCDDNAPFSTDDGSYKLDNQRIDASTKSSTFSHWGTSNNLKIAPTKISDSNSANKQITETPNIPSTFKKAETYKSSSKIAATSISSIFSHSGNTNVSHNLDITKVTATSTSTTFSKAGSSKTCQCNLLEKDVFEKSNTVYTCCSCSKCSIQESELTKTMKMKSVSTNEPLFQICINNKKENQKVCFNAIPLEQNISSITSKRSEEEMNIQELNSKKMNKRNRTCHELVQTDIPNYGTFVQMHEMGNYGAKQLDKACNCIEQTEDCMTSEHFKLSPTKIITNNHTCQCSKLPKQQFYTRHKILQLNICDYELGVENNQEFNEEGEYQIVVNSLQDLQNYSEYRNGSARITQNTIFQLDNLNVENNVKRICVQNSVTSKRAKSV